MHVPYSYGFAIILLTVIVKAVTFPLSKKQVFSLRCDMLCLSFFLGAIYFIEVCISACSTSWTKSRPRWSKLHALML